jgi:hypothetical protein
MTDDPRSIALRQQLRKEQPDTHIHNLFLLQDFASTQSYRLHFSQMRMAALGGALTLMLGIVGFTQKEAGSANLALSALLLLLTFVLIQVEGHLSRGVTVFSNHMAWIEQRLGTVGLATYLPDVIAKNPRYTGTNAFAIILRTINVVTSGYVVAHIVGCFDAGIISTGVEIALGAAVLIILLYNDVQVRSNFASPKVRAEIHAAMSAARDEYTGGTTSP